MCVYSVFQENEGVGGTFGASFNSIDFFGNIMFLNNSGPALRVSEGQEFV